MCSFFCKEVCTPECSFREFFLKKQGEKKIFKNSHTFSERGLQKRKRRIKLFNSFMESPFETEFSI